MSEWSDRRIIVVAGSGGVGKTTVSAALATAFALRGDDAVVLTVDPARRLANALGLDGFSQELQQVALPTGATGRLRASMLDSRRYFDRVIERFAKSPEQRERIQNHPLWRLSLEYLGGTQEYAAMERILEFAKDPTIRRIVVDTPPTQNALDLFAAPERLAAFLESSVLKWFRPGSGSFFGLDLLRRGSRVALALLQKVLGGDFLERLGQFLQQLEGMEVGFRERQKEVLALLRSTETSFVLVSHPSGPRFAESRAFKNALTDQGIDLPCVVLNRVEPKPPDAARSGDAPPSGEDLARAERILEFQRALFAAEKGWRERFRGLDAKAEVHVLERRSEPVHSVAELSQLGRTLLHLKA